MANIFFAWEIGSNLGHLMSIWPVAEELCRRGHRVTLAVKDLARFAQINKQLPVTVVQSPIFFPPAHTVHENLGYCDILAAGGYRSSASLLPPVLAWRELFALTNADVVVCQHAPTALLTARTAGLPSVAIGSGFMCPPALTPLPAYSKLTVRQRQRLSNTEAEVLHTCNRILAKFSASPLSSVADLFRDASTILCTYPELDHYDERGDAEYVGPLYADAEANAIPFPRQFKKNVLVYLNNFKYWKNYLAVFAALKANVVCAAVGLPDNEIRQMDAPHITIVNRPIALERSYPTSDLVVNHGGPGVIAGALAAKKPVLLLPTQNEQLMLARRVKQQGYGDYISFDAPAVQIRSVIDHLLSDAFDQTAVQYYAKRYGSHIHRDALIELIADKIQTAVQQ